MFIIVSGVPQSFIFFYNKSSASKKRSTKKTAENKCNRELSSGMKTNIIKNVKKKILVISKSDTWNLICPRC